MVAAKDEEVFWVFNFVGKKETDRFQGLLSSIHIIAKEEVVRFRGEATVLEKAQQVVILTVNVAADLRG